MSQREIFQRPAPPLSQATPADHLLPGDRIRRDGREFVVQRVLVTPDQPVCLTLRPAHDTGSLPVQLQLRAAELLHRIL